MPKIYLKPNSPEYAEDSKPRQNTSLCDMPGCRDNAEFRAPKDRSLRSYYTFCYEHVRAYNQAWNFMNGLSEKEIEQFMWDSNLWDRPTWKRQNHSKMEEDIRARTWQTYHFTDKNPHFENSHSDHQFTRKINENTPEGQAVRILGLSPPINFEKLRKRYKELVKKFHPDVQRDSPEAEEAMKKINMAYTILKVAYQKFETLPDV